MDDNDDDNDDDRQMSPVMRKPVYAICEKQMIRSASAFVVHCLDSIIPILTKSNVPRL